MALMKRKFLFEADDDGTDATNTSDQTTTDTGDDGASTDDSTTTDDNTETPEENTDGDDNGDDDFSIDATPEEDSGEDDTIDSGDNTDSTDNTSSDMESDSTEESEIDAAMFDTLDEIEKKTKIAALKKSFIDLYSKSDILIDKFNSIDEDDDEFNPVVKRIIKILYDIKEYSSYYILNIFDSKSYIENSVVFKRHLSVLNGIKLIVKEMEQEQQKQSDQQSKN